MQFLYLSAIIFCIGFYGLLTRRNLKAILLSVELMLNAVNINLLYFAAIHKDFTGHIFALFVIGIGAAEAACAIAIILLLYNLRHTVDTEKINELKW